MEEAKKVAKADGMAVNQLINVAVAEKVSAFRTEEYFVERAAIGDFKKALQVLKRAGRETQRLLATNCPEDNASASPSVSYDLTFSCLPFPLALETLLRPRAEVVLQLPDTAPYAPMKHDSVFLWLDLQRFAVNLAALFYDGDDCRPSGLLDKPTFHQVAVKLKLPRHRSSSLFSR